MDSVPLCPICDAGETEVVWGDVIVFSNTERYSYYLRRCARCMHHFLDPLPTPQIIQTYYKSLGTYGPYEFHHDSVGERYPRLKMWIAQNRFPEQGMSPLKKPEFEPQRPPGILLKRALSQGLAMLAELLVGRLISFSLNVPLQCPFDASILDIGCGAGDWLIYMRQAGYQNVMGQDIAGPAVERLQEQAIPVIVGNLCEIQIPSNSFDLIRMEHVIEHLPDPVAYMHQVKRLLKPGGRLVINTPWIESLSFRLGRQHWAGLAPLYHLNYFSHRSLYLLAERVGLRPNRYRFLPVFEVMIGSAKSRMRPAIYRLLRTQPMRSALESLYGITMRLLGKGDFLTAEFIKPERAPVG